MREGRKALWSRVSLPASAMAARGFVGKAGRENILSVRFNQDSSCFALTSDQGFYIYQCGPLRKCYERMGGAVGCAEMLFSTSLVIIVGDGENQGFSARTLRLVDWRSAEDHICELSFLFGIAAVRLNKTRLVVVLPAEIQVFDLSQGVSRLQTYKSPNAGGVCAMSEVGLFAAPTETIGAVRVIDTEVTTPLPPRPCCAHSTRRLHRRLITESRCV